MKNEYHIETTPIVPSFRKDGTSYFSEPHEKYIRAAQKTIQIMTKDLDCFLWIDYIYGTNEFYVDNNKSKNISPQLTIEIENKIRELVHSLQQN